MALSHSIACKVVGFVLAAVVAAPPLHAAGPASASAVASGCHLPNGIDAPDDLRRHMDVMFQESATFRHQCQQLAIEGLYVRIRLDAQFVDRSHRAQTVINRSEGVLFATVAIGAFGDPTEWLAHEFEHIIEQIEGVRIPALIAEGGGQAWRSGETTFETARAFQAGRLVKREVREGHRQAAAASATPQAAGSGE